MASGCRAFPIPRAWRVYLLTGFDFREKSRLECGRFEPITPRGIPRSRAFDERLAPYGGEFDVKRGPPGRAFDYQDNVGQRQLKDCVEKAKATRLRKNVTGCLSAVPLWKKQFAVIIVVCLNAL